MDELPADAQHLVRQIAEELDVPVPAALAYIVGLGLYAHYHDKAHAGGVAADYQLEQAARISGRALDEAGWSPDRW